jgi:type IV pilus assembly protein PilY1
MRKYFVLGIIILVILIFAIVPHKRGLSQGTCPTPNLNYYTSYPPFITSTSTQPNVMIVLDNSGSMFNFSYFDGWSTDTTADDENCYNTGGSPNYCTDFTVPGTYPTFKYYGYFSPDYWYLYDNGRFYPTAPKTGSGLTGARAKTASEWDGNFMNWLTMRRVDIIRKVLTGGLIVATGGENRLITEVADYSGRGIYKQITNAQNYTPYSGTVNFDFSTGSSNPSQFTASGSTYYVRVVTVGNITPTGIVQNMWTSVRWGLSYYHPNTPTPQGGYIYASVNQLSQSSFVNGINNKRPDSNTPLGETLWTNVGYFAQTASWASVGDPGPRYQSGDYTVNNLNDPYNYGTGGQPVYISCSKSFILYITDGEPCADGNLPASLSDYASGRSPYNCQGGSCPAVGSFPASTFPSCYGGGQRGYVAGIEDVALFMHTNDIRTSETKNIDGTQTLTIYPVFAFGKGSTLLRYAAINGGFIDSNGNNIPDLQSEWDTDGDGEPDNFFEATEGYALESALLTALNDILNRASSGGAASVLATTGEGEGAIYQAYFVPGTPGSTATEANWRGYVQALFLDKYGNIREDTNSNDTLDYTSDNIVKMFFDTSITPSRTRVNRYSDADGDGQYAEGDLIDTIELSSVIPIWEGGNLLWSKATDTRKIFTTINGYSYSGLTLQSQQGTFYDGNAAALRPYLRAANTTEATNIINYIRGNNISGYRTKSFTIGGTTNTWKLGDIIYAAPTLVAKPSENLDLIYADSTYTAFYKKYANRRHVLYVGANDGMLHAFNAGNFSATTLSYSGGGYTLGEELWAFIPRDLLPHLKWLTDPNYTHVYYVDLKPKIVDARIFTSEFNNPDGTHPYGWGTILIGGMRFGGKEICVTDDFGSGTEDRTFMSSYFAIDITDPLNPTLLWTFTHENLALTTSYPAILRVGPRDEPGTYFVVFGSGPTDYNGTSTQTGKVFTLRISGTSNGVISSWTTGSNYWESGVDFLTGGDNATIDNYAFMADPATVDVGLDYKADVIYIGSTYCDNPIDPLNPEKCSSSNWKGKMYRIATKPDAASAPSTDPVDWTLSVLFDAQQPISTSPNAAMDDRGNLWTFFGTGRFWHTDDRALDGTERWSFYGIKDTCKPWLNPSDTECATPISLADLYNSTSVDVCRDGTTTSCPSVYGTPNLWETIIANAGLKKGWYLNFPTAGERSLARSLVIGGLVAWTSYIPNADDPCAFEGTSRLYATYYKTGTAYYKYVFDQSGDTVLRSTELGVGVPSAVGGVVTGTNTLKGFVQQSTGTIVEIQQTTPFGLKSRIIGWREK